MNDKTKEPVAPVAIEAYENFGEDYAKVIAGNAYNAHYERPSTMALLPDLKNKKVLDAGCGPGAYTPWLLDQGAQVVGVDVSPAMLKIAERNFEGRAEFYLHDLGQPMTMFKDSSFDFILSSLAIHYIFDLKPLFKEFHRLLRSGGSMVFSTHHPFLEISDSIVKNYFQTELLEQEWNTISRPVRVRFYRRPLSEITRAISTSGFVIEEMTEGIVNDSLRKVSPEVYERLSKSPQFLFFRIRKII